jgi:peptidoglycan hydrolase-like protein with peptidoglycan-binding domain
LKRLAIATLPLLLTMCGVGESDTAEEGAGGDDSLALATDNAGDPHASALLGLAYGASASADWPRIKQLQDDLMRLGYIADDLVSNSGYGKTFGPRTLAGLNAFQAFNGLANTTQVNAATVAALANPKPQPMGFDRLVGLKSGSAAPADKGTIKILQDALVAMGYLPATFTSNSGYGLNYGPLTTAAVQLFQSENGVAQSGAIDQATADALKRPRPRPQGLALGLNVKYRSQLGLVKSAAVVGGDGSFRQEFDHGYVAVDADRVLHICLSDGTDLVPPLKLGTVGSTEDGNDFFVSQWGPTPWNSANGAPYGYEDCGPTSVVIVASMLGLMAHPAPADAETAIDAARDAAMGYNTTYSVPMDDPQVVKALKSYGATTTRPAATMAAVDNALSSGHPVVIGSSNTWSAWGQALAVAGNYLNHSNPGGHFVTVLGKAPDSNYVVGDPLSRVGTIEATPATLTLALAGAWDIVEVSR